MKRDITTAAARQLALDLAHRPALGAEDFFLSKSNELAVALIDRWPDWADYGQLLVGPPASGKSHLVNVWRLRAEAAMIPAAALAVDRLAEFDFARPLAIEDIDRGIDEVALFHVLNRVREAGGRLLLTARDVPARMQVGLKDLRSRLLALPSVGIETPDDDLLRAVIVKHFADRQIDVDPPLIDYLLRRIERSLEAVGGIVDTLDKAALGSGRRITRQLARELLGEN